MAMKVRRRRRRLRERAREDPPQGVLDSVWEKDIILKNNYSQLCLPSPFELLQAAI